VITLRQVLDDHEPVLYVTHDAEDGQWQFLHGGDVHEDDARIVALRTIVELDPTVKELANLPLGWVATRDAVGESWRRQEE
jgi:hypothetical protein